MKTFVFGLDLSLNHWGSVVLTPAGKINSIGYQTDKKKYDLFPDIANPVLEDTYLFWRRILPISKDEDKQTAQSRRLVKTTFCVIDWFLHNALSDSKWDTALNLEGYAFGMKNSRSVTQLAELGGTIKNYLLTQCNHTKLRITDPVSVPMWIGNAHATKKQRCEEFLKAAGAQSSGLVETLLELKIETKKDWDGPLTDLADAWILAKILWVELQIREGNLSLKDLPEYQRRVFLRVTEANPTNLLDRPFIKL